MDSVTQAVLGAGIAGAIAPAGQRRKALLLGAALGTLPDLDVFIDYGDAVKNFTYHRGFSHSLFVLLPLSLLLWITLRRIWPPVAARPARWLAVVSLALLTHPLLDAHTAYGTQLFWPLATPPLMFATVFIIDPLYTLPLLVAVIFATALPQHGKCDGMLRGALALSTLYLGWAWLAQATVARHAHDALTAINLADAPVFVTPTPFNTLLWRVVVKTPAGYLEAFDSLLVDEGTMHFSRYTSDQQALQAAAELPSVTRLRWFSRDFIKAEIVDNQLVLRDLRMGQEPLYVFSHVVAKRGNPHWQAVPTVLLPVSIEDRRLSELWQRIWRDGQPEHP